IENETGAMTRERSEYIWHGGFKAAPAGQPHRSRELIFTSHGIHFEVALVWDTRRNSYSRNAPNLTCTRIDPCRQSIRSGEMEGHGKHLGNRGMLLQVGPGRRSNDRSPSGFVEWVSGCVIHLVLPFQPSYWGASSRPV